MYDCRSLLPGGTGLFDYALHSSLCLRHQVQNLESYCWPSDPYEWFTPIGLFSFHYRDVAHRAECLQRDKQKTQMITKDLSTQGPPKERPGFWGQSDHGGPWGPWVPKQNHCALCGQKRHWRKDCDQCTLCQQSVHGQRGHLSCQRVMGAIRLHNRKIEGPEARSDSA